MAEKKPYITDPSRQCTAKAKGTGNRCGKYAIPGGTVCKNHGGAASQVKNKAKLRLLEMVDPALKELNRIMLTGADDKVKLAAVKDILDRAGVPRQTETTVMVEDARDLLLLKLQELE